LIDVSDRNLKPECNILTVAFPATEDSPQTIGIILSHLRSNLPFCCLSPLSWTFFTLVSLFPTFFQHRTHTKNKNLNAWLRAWKRVSCHVHYITAL